MRLHALAAIVALSASLVAAPPDSPFPVPPLTPIPAPMPLPDGAVLNLATGSLYIVNSPVDGELVVWPEELVTVAKKKGPLTIDGVFADAKVAGESETRDYAGPCVYVVKAALSKDGKPQSGRARAIFISPGFTSKTDWKRSVFDVNGGGTLPVVPVDPVTPVVPADPLLAAVQAAYTADTSATKSADKTSLAAVYLAMADAVPSIGTAGGLLQVLTQSRTARIGDRLPTVRALLNAKLQAMFPKDGTLTAEQKTAAANQFKAFAAILAGVK